MPMHYTTMPSVCMVSHSMAVLCRQHVELLSARQMWKPRHYPFTPVLGVAHDMHHVKVNLQLHECHRPPSTSCAQRDTVRDASPDAACRHCKRSPCGRRVIRRFGSWRGRRGRRAAKSWLWLRTLQRNAKWRHLELTGTGKSSRTRTR